MEEEFVLPENWYINMTEENIDIVNKWIREKFQDGNKIIYSKYYLGTDYISGMFKYPDGFIRKCYALKKSEVKKGYGIGTEITTEQFKKYVMKEELENNSGVQSPDAKDQQLKGVNTSMPRYRCHKEVRALRIIAITPAANGMGFNLIFSEKDDHAQIYVSESFMNKHNPQIGGYYVVYDDGYESFSPAKAFEEGYTLIEEDDELVAAQGKQEPEEEEKKEKEIPIYDVKIPIYDVDFALQYFEEYYSKLPRPDANIIVRAMQVDCPYNRILDNNTYIVPYNKNIPVFYIGNMYHPNQPIDYGDYIVVFKTMHGLRTLIYSKSDFEKEYQKEKPTYMKDFEQEKSMESNNEDFEEQCKKHYQNLQALDTLQRVLGAAMSVGESKAELCYLYNKIKEFVTALKPF